MAAGLSLYLSRFVDENGLKRGGEFCVFGLARPDAKVAKFITLKPQAAAAHRAAQILS